MNSWWFLWLIVMCAFLVPSLGYGWGYRGWGPPYPRYVQRRLGPPGHIAHNWGFGGDLIWLMFFIGMMWVVMGLWFPVWRR
jgi:hypothetical protein